MSWAARVVWAYLPCFADKEGRLDDKPISLKMAMLPNDAVNMDAILSELASRQFVARYQVDGRRFIEIRNWSRYQRPYPKEPKSHRPQYSAGLETPMRDLQDTSEVSMRSLVGATSDPDPGPDPDPIPVRVEPAVQQQKPKPKAPAEIRSETGEPECPAWEVESCWSATKEIWERAGRWVDGPENFREARKKFDRNVTADNWPQFFQGLDWAVTNSLRSEDRKYLGVLYTFIDDEKWREQPNPYTPERQKVDQKIDLSPPVESEPEWE